MNRTFLIGLLILCANRNISIAQIVDLTSVDEFFKVTSILKEGKEISEEQWKDFDSSSGYKEFAEKKDKTLINTIKTSINIVFGNVTIVEKAKQRLSSFLGKPIDSTTEFKPVYFLFIIADGKAKEDALYIDFNLIYKKTEEQRVNFLAHEFFHNYREKYENHDFNYKNDFNHCIDFIQNEGIADLIDKSEGYEKYFTENDYQ